MPGSLPPGFAGRGGGAVRTGSRRTLACCSEVSASRLSSRGRLGLDRTRARFLLVHLDVDVEHGARAQALCESLGAHGPEPLLDGAHQAADFWVAIHRRVLAEA
ncbi:hypothetical protein [Corallococcus exiguus]|uniref:hypothetical protein n=1 Tax=Corallococcus exiguus TaxID=83462 RepID=UPI003DA35430